MLVTSDSVDADTFEEQTGWRVKPEGACKGEHCVPLPPEVRDLDGTLRVSVLAERLGMPMVLDEASGLTAIGPETSVTGRMLTTAETPEPRTSHLRRRHVPTVEPSWASGSAGCMGFVVRLRT
jgi:hypothetical protein